MLKFLTPLAMLVALAGCAGQPHQGAGHPSGHSARHPDPGFIGPERPPIKPTPRPPIKEDPPLPKPPFFE